MIERRRRRSNQVLSRFTLVDGVLPLDLEKVEAARKDNRPKFHPVTRDGGRLERSSTGQRAKVAAFWLTAQNQALTPYIDHHTLLFDDVSTAYDLSNPAREAILWQWRREKPRRMAPPTIRC